MELVLWDLPPWSAAPSAAKEAPQRAHRRAAARHAERRSRRPWSDAESLLLARLVMQQELEQAGRVAAWLLSGCEVCLGSSYAGQSKGQGAGQAALVPRLGVGSAVSSADVYTWAACVQLRRPAPH